MPAASRSAAAHLPRRLPSVGSPSELSVLRLAARQAEDAGDFAGARRLVARMPPSAECRRWLRQLGAVLQAEDEVARACWLVHPAVRWAYDVRGQAMLEGLAELLLRVLGVPAAQRCEALPDVVAQDPVVLDAGVFDSPVFDGYLAALARVDGPMRADLARWSRTPASVFRITGFAGTGQQSLVLLRDLCRDTEVACRAWAAAAPSAVGELIHGRLVAVMGVNAFALDPVVVDPRCSARLLRARRQGSGPEERIRAVARARLRSRLAAA